MPQAPRRYGGRCELGFGANEYPTGSRRIDRARKAPWRRLLLLVRDVVVLRTEPLRVCRELLNALWMCASAASELPKASSTAPSTPPPRERALVRSRAIAYPKNRRLSCSDEPDEPDTLAPTGSGGGIAPAR
eukprot:CAMPEP_0181228248 /NCGR_PEP_ID=MMETSP1096-20121128/33249_1 /TAXON_ID=156174 ORGANISM="Chrysochromulina ericina, Strain CCMP281" /NCGR_SAMPLE_ID=MMETSP1096 /ASSEMBLY_ACC=CAM_ASM_000453 /LENGTH=131 /DNA_ID=CAMNT_0023321765 /DNA_START=63 /DNA_END=455 /DNA_ORIENTATION=+